MTFRTDVNKFISKVNCGYWHATITREFHLIKELLSDEKHKWNNYSDPDNEQNFTCTVVSCQNWIYFLFSVCLYLSPCPSVSHSLSVSVSLYLSFSLSLSLSLSLSVSLSLFVCLSVSLPLSLCLSLSVSVSLSVSLSVSVCLSVSFSLFQYEHVN